jgi:hypothetical protein
MGLAWDMHWCIFKFWLVQGLYWIFRDMRLQQVRLMRGAINVHQTFDDNDNGNRSGHYEETYFHLLHSFLVPV